MARSSLTDPDRLEPLLEWLAGRLGVRGLRLAGDPVPPSNGSSNETVVLRCTWDDADGRREQAYVARTAPRGEGLFLTYDLDRQYRTMAALARTDVPVPRLVGHAGPEVMGEAFYVMEAAPGEAPPDLPPYTTTGWLLEADPADQRRVHDATLEVLARVHRLDAGTLGLGFLNRTGAARGLDDQLADTGEWYRWATGGRPQATMDAVWAWLQAELPTDLPADGLNWGDARFGNVLYVGNEPSCVLDWEMAAIGPAEIDMGWWFSMNRFYTEGTGAPPLPGFPTKAEAIAHYEAALGRRLERLEWYEALGAFRFGIVFIRAAALAGADPGPGGMGQLNPVTTMLAADLDLPEPASFA